MRSQSLNDIQNLISESKIFNHAKKQHLCYSSDSYCYIVVLILGLHFRSSNLKPQITFILMTLSVIHIFF